MHAHLKNECTYIIWASTRGFANNKCADQPAHPRSLISAFVVRLLESIISKFATFVQAKFHKSSSSLCC